MRDATRYRCRTAAWLAAIPIIAILILANLEGDVFWGESRREHGWPLTSVQFQWSENYGPRPRTLPFDRTWSRIAVYPVGAVVDMTIAAFILLGTVAGAEFCVRRRFHRLHPVTWVVALLLGSALIYGNVLQSRWLFYHMKGHYFRGWPYPYTVEHESPASFMEDLSDIYVPNLVKNVAWSAVLLASPVILIERWARRHFRATLRGMFIALTLFAFVLGAIRPRLLVALPEFLVWQISILIAGICALTLLALLTVNAAIRVYHVTAGKATSANIGHPQSPASRDRPAADG